MPGKVDFLSHKALDAIGNLVAKDSFNADIEYAEVLRRATFESPERYEVAESLFKSLLDAAADLAKHLKKANEFRPYTSKKSNRTYSIFLAETGDSDLDGFFMAYLALFDAGRAHIIAIHSGERNRRPSYQFYNEVWAEIVRRLQLKGL